MASKLTTDGQIGAASDKRHKAALLLLAERGHKSVEPLHHFALSRVAVLGPASCCKLGRFPRLIASAAEDTLKLWSDKSS